MTAPLAPRPPDALAQPAAPPGFFTGTRELFAGLGYIVRTPAAWPLALVPVAVAGVVTVLVGATLLAIVTPRVAAMVGDHAVLAALAKILAGVLALILAALIGAGVAQPLSGPALNRLVRGAEAELGAPPWPQIGFVEDVGRALGSMMVGYMFGLPLLAILATITFFVPPAAVVTFPLKLVVLAILFAWDFCDYPLSLHGMPLGKRIALVVRHARAMIGFGLGLALLSLIPCAPFFALPIGVAGAARLVQRIERSERAARPVDG
jgi:CysZ protein